MVLVSSPSMVAPLLTRAADSPPQYGCTPPCTTWSRLLQATTSVCCRASEHPALQDGQPLCGEGRCRLCRWVTPPEGSPGQLSRGRPPQVGSSTACVATSQHSALHKCWNAGKDSLVPQQLKVCQTASSAGCRHVADSVWPGRASDVIECPCLRALSPADVVLAGCTASMVT